MWAAVRYDQKEVVKSLLNSDIDIDAFPYCGIGRFHTALQIAAAFGNVSMARFLLERGALVTPQEGDQFGSLPIEAAALCGQEEVVELLIEHGADPAQALYAAAKGGQSWLIKYLLSRFPDLPYRDGGQAGISALHSTLCTPNLTAMTMLVDAGVSLNHGYEYPSHLPLHMATEGGLAPWVIRHLILLGAQGTSTEAKVRDTEVTVRGVRISERTWEWVGKY